MAIYFVQAALILLLGLTYRVNQSNENKKRYLIFAFGLIIVLAALRSYHIGTDLATHYARRYEQIANYNWNQIPEFSKVTTYELGYCYLCKILSLINPDVQFYIIMTSIFTYGVIGRFIYKNSTDVKMSTIIFVFTCTSYMYMNIVRQAIAISIVLLGYEILKSDRRTIVRYFGFAFFVFLASSIHISAIMCLTFILFDFLKFTKKEIVIGVLLIIIFFVLYQQIFIVVLRIFGLTNEYTGYLTKDAESVGYINLQSIYMVITIAWSFMLGAYYLVIKKRRTKTLESSNRNIYFLQRSDSFILFAGLMASICRLMVFRMNIINRYSYFFVPFVLLLYPRAIGEIPNASNRKLIRVLTYLMLLVYFVWMTFVYEAKFHSTVPYEFFWQI